MVNLNLCVGLTIQC